MERSYGLWATLVIAATMILPCSSVFGTEIHVNSGGSDTNPGTVARPIQTLGAAQLVARPLAAKGPVRVLLHSGVYYLPQPLV
ncbi:MAG: hypothetical protein U1E05_26150, partial [Patescibacteria group bacterium]|nr:hypothetical protein [Patescibacteria group bacterium]